MMCGGFGQAKPADEEVKKIALEVKPQVEQRANGSFQVFEAVSYTTQVVAGTNYKIKVKIGDNQFVHIKVFKPLPCANLPLEVLEVEPGKKLGDAL